MPLHLPGRPVSSGTGFLLAVVFTAVAVAARWTVDPWLGDQSALISLPAAVAAAAWVGGWPAAVLAAIVGYVACAYLFIGRSGGFGFYGIAGLFPMAAYAVSCVVIISLAEALRGLAARHERALLDRKRAGATRALLASIVATSDDAIVSKTLDGVIQSWNAGAERLFGYTAAEAIGQPITLIIPQERRQEELSILERLRRGERIDPFETVRVAKDGRRVDVSLTISPVRDDEGEIVGASKIARDIAERVRTQEALRDADRRKTEFLATLAHELRNPLAPIRNSLEIIKRADGDRDLLRQGRDAIERQVAHMVRLVDDLLDVSRITRDELELRKTGVELASVVHQAVETCRPLAERENQTIEVRLPGESVYLDADPVRLAQVFSNLLHNACKYTPPGGSISLTAETRGDGVVVSVKDSGIGISPAQIGSIFDMFARVDTTLERSRGGLGIGLTLVKRLVEMHGGTIEAHSDGAGLGSEFSVRLPLLAGKPAAHEQPVAAANIGPGSAPHRVLVVDDNVDSADSLATLMRLSGHETRIAYDGEEALAAAEEFRPEAILLDIGLPKLHGFGVCRRVRAEPWGEGIVMVALTGWGQDEDRQRSKDAGFDRHIVKPVDYQALTELLDSLLAEKEGQTASG
jgi:PAS domain S-box-containing protein